MKTPVKTIETPVYLYSQLESGRAKECARDWYLSGHPDISEFAWENIKGDAENIGLKITELHQHKANRGAFIKGARACAEAILKEHGESCETFKTALKFMGELAIAEKNEENEENEDEIEEIEAEFLQSLLQDYWYMLDKEIEYQSSEEVLAETFAANGYTFTEDGKRFG